jgi:sugar phosphate isomerase/epimerase
VRKLSKKSKVISLRFDEDEYNQIMEKAKERGITITEFLKGLFMEKPKPQSLKEILERLDFDLTVLWLCVKPLEDLVFDLQKYIAMKTMESMKDSKSMENETVIN